ncbi:hypothetical protein GCM10009623_08790 [Nocardioides aestuarii]|uniref:Uncharacterized protein n=1 Tax=Nocardioides aestuarii TaxID=252231 RepID=A0ABW4TEY5_9ACTN
MNPMHLGALHGVEQALTIGLAFGPFVLLALVILVRRRQDARDTGADEQEQPQG